MLSKLKLRFGHARLRKQLKSVLRDKRVHNLVTARSVGVLLHAPSEEHVGNASELVAFLTEKNMEVCLLVYYPEKDLPQRLISQENVNVFSRKEINWFGKPMALFVGEFLNMDFDILIDLSMQESFPIHWIASLSVAKFKVGNLSYEGNPYDLVISTKQEEGLDFYIKQIKHYLNLINNRFAQEQSG
jgi:hypothetical protein